MVALFISLRGACPLTPCTLTLHRIALAVHSLCSHALAHRLDFVEAKGDGTVDLRFQSSAESAEVAARRTGGSSRHIDWVLVHHPEGCGTQLTVGTAAVITDQVESLSAGRRTKRYPSDHFPVAVEFWVHSKN